MKQVEKLCAGNIYTRLLLSVGFHTGLKMELDVASYTHAQLFTGKFGVKKKEQGWVNILTRVISQKEVAAIYYKEFEDLRNKKSSIIHFGKVELKFEFRTDTKPYWLAVVPGFKEKTEMFLEVDEADLDIILSWLKEFFDL
jgi:hypothetical protein